MEDAGQASERTQSVPDIKHCTFFFLCPRHIHYDKPASWETGAAKSWFPDLLIFRDGLTSTPLLWFISAFLRGIIPHHQTTLHVSLSQSFGVQAKTSRPQEEAEAVLTFLGSGSSLICKYKTTPQNNLEDTSSLSSTTAFFPIDQVFKKRWTTEEGVKAHCTILLQSLPYKLAGSWPW